MFRNLPATHMDIGQQNIEMAHRLLHEYGLTVADEHLGSFGHRKISFDVWSGQIRLSHVDYMKKRS